MFSPGRAPARAALQVARGEGGALADLAGSARGVTSN